MEEEEDEEDGQILSLGDFHIEHVRDRIAIISMLTVRVVVLEYSQLHKKAYNVSLEALKMYCVMRASAPSLHNIYQRYDKYNFLYSPYNHRFSGAVC